MKASELIKELQKQIKEHGDLEVYACSYEPHGTCGEVGSVIEICDMIQIIFIDNYDYEDN